MLDEYRSTREAAVSLNVPYQTLMGWVYKSKVRASRRGRYWFIHLDEIDRVRIKLGQELAA